MAIHDPHDRRNSDPTTPSSTGVAQTLVTFFLTANRQQRLRLAHTLTAAFIFFICILLLVYSVHVGICDIKAAMALSVGMAATSLSFYAFIRSGLNLRLREPALTLPQILTAMTWVCAAYAITNQSHGGVLILYALVMGFGMFNMSQRGAYAASAYGVLAMGATMYYKSSVDPMRYPRQIEWVYFMFVLFIIPTIGQFSTEVTQMRHRLREQKATLQKQKIDLEQAMERIRELATRDELTGLINRREMASLISQHAQRQQRKAMGFSVAMIDLDHFKHVNDTWGHRVGDAVLRTFAQQSRLWLRETDVVARWGGEEFLVLMPETSDLPPGAAIERLREHLIAFVVYPEVAELRITFSSGVTAYRSGESIEDAIARADKALYDAKQQGRNRTVIG